MSRFHDKTMRAAERYSAAYKALSLIDLNGEWTTQLRYLDHDKDLRSPRRNDDDGSLETTRELSWIWLVPREDGPLASPDEINDSKSGQCRTKLSSSLRRCVEPSAFWNGRLCGGLNRWLCVLMRLFMYNVAFRHMQQSRQVSVGQWWDHLQHAGIQPSRSSISQLNGHHNTSRRVLLIWRLISNVTCSSQCNILLLLHFVFKYVLQAFCIFLDRQSVSMYYSKNGYDNYFGAASKIIQ
jgi:hypothetical protein